MTSNRHDQEIYERVCSWARQRIERQENGNLYLGGIKITIERFGVTFIPSDPKNSLTRRFWQEMSEKPIRFVLRYGWTERDSQTNIFEETVDGAIKAVKDTYEYCLRNKYPEWFKDEEEEVEEPIETTQMQQLCFNF